MPVQAQALLADPTVWTAVSFGGITWAQDVDPNARDNIMSNFSVAVASPRWMIQSGAQISGDLTYFEWADVRRVTYRSFYGAAGPWTQSTWFMGGAVAGPAVTWGVDEKADSYFSLGLVGSVQGFVRLDGRVWIGGETMLVANPSSTHLATRLALRVDLLRPDR